MTSNAVEPGASVPCAGCVTIATATNGEPQLPTESASDAARVLLSGSQLRPLSAPPAAAGASLTPLTLMANVHGADVSWPPLAVPPLSWATAVTLATPHALGAGVYVSVPSGLIAGCTLNSDGLSLLTTKCTV